jgi:hypothetical protein
LAAWLGAALLGPSWTVALPGFAREPDPFNFPPVNFEILDPKTREIVGYGGYRIERDDGALLLKGENRYLNGDYDVEVGRLRVSPDRALPILLEFEHLFFNPDGSMQTMGRVDFTSGDATCTSYRGGSETTRRERLEVPSYTFAGATVLIPIQEFLRAGRTAPFRLHAFNCAPGPRILPVEVNVGPPQPFPYGGLETVKADVTPRFGWWDFMIKPFLPELNAWFDPNRGFSFVGATLARYYRGPQIVLVAASAARPGASPPQ